MFFLLPRVALVLLAAFAVLALWRVWRQQARPGRRHRRRGQAGRRPARSLPLVPATLLRGAERTWVVFTTPECEVCRRVASRLREAEPASRVVEVDSRREPRLVEAFGIPRLPAVLLANRYGQVEARLIGLAAIDDFTSAQTG
jgi:hypothetical protein